MAISLKSINTKIKKLVDNSEDIVFELVKGENYYYFQYWDGRVFHTYSVMVMHLNQISFQTWISEAIECLKEVEQKYGK